VYYTAEATNDTYAFVSAVVTSAAAQRSCNDLGGHLVSYVSLAEQVEVEQVSVRCMTSACGAE
jgi:hypothetical protein